MITRWNGYRSNEAAKRDIRDVQPVTLREPRWASLAQALNSGSFGLK